MRDYRFDFANGTTDLVETMAVRTGYIRFYELLSGGGIDPRIRVESMGGGWQCILRPGQGFRLPAEEPTGVVVTNLSGVAMAGNIKLGPRDWQFEDQRLTGTVSVVDSNFALTQAGQAFAPYLFLAASAGNFGHIQFLNPIGSGRIIEVQSLIAGLGAATGVTAVLTSPPFAALTTLAPADANQSKLASGGVAGVLQVRSQVAAAALQTTRVVWAATLAAAGSHEKIWRAPILLNPGDGLMIVVGAVNIGLTANAETVERPQV